MSAVVRAGYKLTEVGVIPKDWTTTPIGQCLKIRHGKSQHEVVSPSGEFPIFGTGGEMGKASRPLYSKQSVLIGRKGTIDAPRFLDTPFWTVDTLFYSEVNEDADPKFMFYQFCLIDWYAYNEASGVPSLNARTIEKISIPYPPNIVEQRAIAAALSDVDALLAKQGQLIAKKHGLKQAAMQQLLTGQTRLPGFSGDWSVLPLQKVCWFQEGPGVRTHQFKTAGVKLLNGTNIAKGKVLLETTNRYISQIEADGAYNHFLVDEGDILLATSGITIDRLDEKVAIAKREDLPLCMNTSTVRFKVSNAKLTASYLYVFLRSNEFKNQIGQQATGSAQINFGPSHLEKIEISVPPTLIEQTAIATILSDMDTEIAALEERQTKTRALKQGMMQELLTGKTRLV